MELVGIQCLAGWWKPTVCLPACRDLSFSKLNAVKNVQLSWSIRTPNSGQLANMIDWHILIYRIHSVRHVKGLWSYGSQLLISGDDTSQCIGFKPGSSLFIFVIGNTFLYFACVVTFCSACVFVSMFSQLQEFELSCLWSRTSLWSIWFYKEWLV